MAKHFKGYMTRSQDVI